MIVLFVGDSHTADTTCEWGLDEHSLTRLLANQKIIRKNKGNAFRNNYPEGIFV